VTLTRVESIGKKHDSSRVTIVSQCDPSRVTESCDASRVIDSSHAITGFTAGFACMRCYEQKLKL